MNNNGGGGRMIIRASGGGGGSWPSDENHLIAGNGTAVTVGNGLSLAAGTLTSAGAYNRQTEIDANTYILWKLDETSGVFANTGTGGSLDLNLAGSTVRNFTGLFDTCVSFSNTSAGLYTNTPSFTPPSTSALTVSAWVYPRAFSAGNNVASKEYKNWGQGGNPSRGAPYVTFDIGLDNGTPTGAVTVSGTQNRVTASDASYYAQLSQWQLLALVYDGSTLKLYLNGNECALMSLSGAIDFQDGPFLIGAGGGPVVTIGGGNMAVDDVRVESVARSQAYLRDMYKRGLNLSD
jgi:hypothetical protein